MGISSFAGGTKSLVLTWYEDQKKKKRNRNVRNTRCFSPALENYSKDLREAYLLREMAGHCQDNSTMEPHDEFQSSKCLSFFL